MKTNTPLTALLGGKQWTDCNWPLRAASGELAKDAPQPGLPWPTNLRWLKLLNPLCTTDNMTLGDCSVRNMLSRVLLDDYVATGQYRELQFANIYETLLQQINGNTEDEGFQLIQAVGGCQRLGIIKADTLITEVPLDQVSIVNALMVAPLVLGLCALGIMPDDLSPDGYADESDTSELDIMQAGGHCELLAGGILSPDTNNLPVGIILSKGWGQTCLYGEGITFLTVARIIYLAMCPPLLLTHPSGDLRGANFERWLL